MFKNLIVTNMLEMKYSRWNPVKFHAINQISRGIFGYSVLDSHSTCQHPILSYRNVYKQDADSFDWTTWYQHIEEWETNACNKKIHKNHSTDFDKQTNGKWAKQKTRKKEHKCVHWWKGVASARAHSFDSIEAQLDSDRYAWPITTILLSVFFDDVLTLNNNNKK